MRACLPAPLQRACDLLLPRARVQVRQGQEGLVPALLARRRNKSHGTLGAEAQPGKPFAKSRRACLALRKNKNTAHWEPKRNRAGPPRGLKESEQFGGAERILELDHELLELIELKPAVPLSVECLPRLDHRPVLFLHT